MKNCVQKTSARPTEGACEKDKRTVKLHTASPNGKRLNPFETSLGDKDRRTHIS